MTNIERHTIPAITVASLRKKVADYHEEGNLWQEIESLLASSQAPVDVTAMAGATFHDLDFKPTDIDLEVWVQVTEPFTPNAPLECKELPEREVLRAVLHGDYSQIASVARDVDKHIAEHGMRIGAMFNIYRVGPAQNPDPNMWVTEVCFPILEG